jgi:hypothetical protein
VVRVLVRFVAKKKSAIFAREEIQDFPLCEQRAAS